MRLSTLALLCILPGAGAQDAAGTAATSLHKAVERLQLPGININLAKRSVDVAATVCLDEGTLELIACTKDTKEHESILTVDASAVHIHTALLLLGAKAGHPALRQRVGGDDGHWVNVPPEGGKVEVYLVVKPEGGKPIERPISDFIAPTDGADNDQTGKPKFPTHTFLFAGSRLVPNGDGPRTYLSDRDGNVISIATFGDELLCLPEIHSKENGALLWQVDPTHLPPVGTSVTLRLRPNEPTFSR